MSIVTTSDLILSLMVSHWCFYSEDYESQFQDCRFTNHKEYKSQYNANFTFSNHFIMKWSRMKGRRLLGGHFGSTGKR